MQLTKNHIIAYTISLIIIVLMAIKIWQHYNEEPAGKTRAKISIAKNQPLDIVFGNDSATLSVYMYASYNCSYCRKFFTDVMPELSSLMEKGKLKIVMRLTSKTKDQRLKRALKTVVCVNHYGNFEHLHKLLLHDPKVAYTQDFQNMIDEFSIKDPFVGECIDGEIAAEHLEKNLKEFNQLELKGTPSFVINDIVYQGYRDPEVFKKIIESHLSKFQTNV